MSPEFISILVLGLIFVIATLLPVNIGVLAFAGAFLVGTLVADQSTDDIIAGFPSDLFLTLVGITYLFAVAQNNGTVDWLVELAVRAVRGRIGAMPWIMFALAAVLTAVGAVSPGAVAIIAPIALGFAVQYQISPLLMGLMVIHGAQAGGFSPISIYGGITNGVVEEAGLPLNEVATFLASLFANLAVAVLLFVVLGGRDLLRRRAEVAERVGGDAAEPAGAGGTGDGRTAPGEDRRVLAGSPQQGAQAYGDAEMEARSEERELEEPPREAPEAAAEGPLSPRGLPTPHRGRDPHPGRVDPVLRGRHRVRSHHHRPGPHPHGAAAAETGGRSGHLAGDPADHRGRDLCRRAGGDGHHRLRGRGRGRPGLATAGGAVALLHRGGRLGLRVLDRGPGIADPPGGAVPAGRDGRQPGRVHRRLRRLPRPLSTSARSPPTAPWCWPTPRPASTRTASSGSWWPTAPWWSRSPRSCSGSCSWWSWASCSSHEGC